MIFWHISIIFLSSEVFWWGCVLNKHSLRMKEISDQDIDDFQDHSVCFKRNWLRVFMASVLATALSMGVMLWWLTTWALGYIETFVYPQWIACGIQLSHIHLFAIVARCSCLEVGEWPPVSRAVSTCLRRNGLID